MRYFCPVIGRVVDADDGPHRERHPTCDWPWWAHPPVPDGECGETAACGDHGHPCTLAPGHDGPHQTPGCGDG